MIDKILVELDNDLTAITYDVIFNHSILSSLDLSWDNFDVYPPEIDAGKNFLNEEKYRRFRSNLHSLIISSVALIENTLMRMYLVTNIGFNQANYKKREHISKIEGVLCVEPSSMLCNLFNEFKSISDVIFSIKDEFAHSSKAEMTDYGISNVHIAYDPDKELELEVSEIRLSLNQFLEHIGRMMHILLDAKTEVDIQEERLNSLPLSNIAKRFVSGFQHAKLELRRSAVSIDPTWIEFETRVKDLSYY